jgi:hypothetical protein
VGEHFGAQRTLTARPLPYQGGELEVAFATPGTAGGGIGEAELALMDVQGRLIRILASGTFPSGLQEISWDGLDDDGREVLPGVYFLRLANHGHIEGTLRVVVVR